MRFALLLLLTLITASHADDFPEVYNSDSEKNFSPMPAVEAAARMQLPEGFSATVFAAEPDVQNPIAMAWDRKNRLWIAENYTYSDGKQIFDLGLRDRVLIFEDVDNDGVADKRSVFTDKVQMLTSVEIGRGGVWLMTPPQLLFIPDADEDGKPDGPAEVVLDGFTIGRASYHNFANGLKWGPDGWLYGRCGHSCPGRIGVPGTPDELRVPIDGGIWRYHTERKIVEVLCHGTVNPWGHDWDEHGELFFINTVIGHLWHMNPGSHFIESFGESENPLVFERMDMIADHYHYDRTGSWSDSRDGKANDLGGGHAHIGMLIYQGETWPQQYRGKLFTLNMHGRRANVERLERLGAGYVGRHEPDFLIAEDPFFRAMDFTTGPDGNVFVIDWSDTGECHERTGVHRTSGRIYKITYDGKPAGKVAANQIVKPSCLAGEGPLPQLWRDYQAGETTPAQLRQLLNHQDEHVRVWAIRLLTDFWPLDTIHGPKKDATYPDDPETRSELQRLAQDDESGLVHLTLASVLQRLPVEHRAELARGLLKHPEHANDKALPYLVWFGLMPVAESDPQTLSELAHDCVWPNCLSWMTRALALQIKETPKASPARGANKALNQLLNAGSQMPIDLQTAILEGMQEAFRGWRQVTQPPAWKAFARSEAGKQHPEIVRSLNVLFGDGRALEDVRKIALDKKADLQIRTQALRTLIDAKPDNLRETCAALLDMRELNVTALQGLMLFDDPEVGVLLTRKYTRFPPNDRPKVLEALVSRSSFAEVLLNAMQDGSSQISKSDITASHARQIKSHGKPELNEKLAKVWGELRESPAERLKLIEQMRRELSFENIAKADLSAGRALFNKTCSQCHMLYGEGKKIAPDLTGSQRSNLDYLLENILDPSAVVSKDYQMVIINTQDGRVLSGLIVSQDDNTLVIQTANEQIRVARSDIEAMKQTTLSPMPDGLLQNLSQEQRDNLFAYLMHPIQVPLPEQDDTN